MPQTHKNQYDHKKPARRHRMFKPAQKVTALVVVIAVAAIGVYLLASGHAQTLSVAAEAENGSLSSSAKLASDVAASGGKAVQFSGQSGGGPVTPSKILKLSNWYLTIPTGSSEADTVMQPALNSYQSSFFQPNAAGDGVVFMAPVKGTTTSGSQHTRSELRETAANGTLPWGWPAASGTHIMKSTEAVTHLPAKNGIVGFAQIHGPGSTWYLILLATGNSDGSATLELKDNTGKADSKVIDSHYVLGTKFDLAISVINGKVTIDYNGTQKVATTSTLKDSYFKIGNYNQSDGDYGSVVVYSLSVTHQ